MEQLPERGAKLDYNGIAAALTLKRGRNVSAKTVQGYHRTARKDGYPTGTVHFPEPFQVWEGKYPRWIWGAVDDWDDNRPGPGWHGEGRPRGTKLNAEQKRDLRAAYEAGECTRRELAEMYNVSYVTVTRITRPAVETAVS